MWYGGVTFLPLVEVIIKVKVVWDDVIVVPLVADLMCSGNCDFR